MSQPVRAFVKAWLRSPRKTGAIVPSTRFLARALAECAAKHSGCIVELGAGTGVVTRALLEAGIAPSLLLVLERDKRLAGILHHRFPDVRIVAADARDLVNILEEHRIHQVQAVVSSLPLLSLPRGVTRTILSGIAQAIGARGELIQYTYGLSSPIPDNLLESNRWQAKKIRRVWLNVPPATIWKYSSLPLEGMGS